MSFREKLKALRKANRLSQFELGNKVGLHEKHITKMENSDTIPSGETLKSIATLFQVSVDYLLFDHTPKNSDIGRVSDPELVDLIFQADTLPETDKKIVKETIDAFLTRSKVQDILKPQKRSYQKRE